MNIKKYIALLSATLLLFMISCASLRAQDVRADLIRLNTNYQNQLVTLNLKLQIYPSYEAKKPAEEMEGAFFQDGKSYYYKLGETELVQTQDFSLMVNHSFKSIMVQPAVETQKVDIASTIDKLVAGATKTQYSGLGQGKARYSFHFKTGPHPRIDLVFDTQSWKIERLIHYYHQGAYHGVNGITEEHAVRTEMVYDEVEIAQQEMESFFNTTRFLSMEQDRYQALPAFSTYRLFDFIHLN